MRDPEAQRGLFLQDHIGKVLTGLLQHELNPHYENYAHIEQYGTVRGRGPSFAAHSSLSFVQYCKMMNLSCAILFIDLTKAFDLALRQGCLGCVATVIALAPTMLPC